MEKSSLFPYRETPFLPQPRGLKDVCSVRNLEFSVAGKHFYYETRMRKGPDISDACNNPRQSVRCMKNRTSRYSYDLCWGHQKQTMISIYIKFSVCLCVRYARSNQWVDLDQTLHAWSLLPRAAYRGYTLG